VLAGVLWGTGDLAHLLIDVGHDVRASRILVARVAHTMKVAPLTVTKPVTKPVVTPERSAIERGGETSLTDRPVPRRNFADRIDNVDDDGPPIP